MKIKIILISVMLLLFQHPAEAINDALRQKYPFSILTDDYQLLDESDLDSYKDGVKPPTALPKKYGESIYWQCFPRDFLSTTLEDEGYSSADFGWYENYGNLKITVYTKPGVIHEYVMRRSWPVSGYQKRFNMWIKLMKNEKYVCLAGSYINKEDNFMQGRKQQKYLWVFEKLKTKKGLDSYS